MKLISKKNSVINRGRIIRKLKWGVAGCGNFLEKTLLPSLQQLKRSKLVSVYSSNLGRATEIAEKYFVKDAFNNFDDFLSSDIDAVYIGSINSDHYDQVLRAARAGKHILCEKPMAINSIQAQEMVDVCRENNVQLMINYSHKFHPLVLKTKELIKKGMLGKIISISVSFNIDLPPSQNFRFKKSKSGGGALWDLGTHMLDLLGFLGGEITEIKGFTDNVIYKSEVEDFANAVIKFEKSGYGQLSVSYNSKRAFNRVEILGYNGSICIENLIGRKDMPAKLIIDLAGEGRKSFRKRANKQLHLLRSVQKAFLSGEPLPYSGDDALKNIKLIEELERNVTNV
ncbi:MAG: Gfo/Idh/MocA family oxidoreductase [Bacteroidetes bacterium]|nr:Gfo/Idh/MocA family oxidoreductase [Bacteroidota bacterium]